jgi:hypothetical protein
MTFLGDFYHQTENFPILDPLRPGVAYERALACATAHGDKHAGTAFGTVTRSFNDAGEIIGWNVRSRHYVGDIGIGHPDKPNDREHSGGR